MDAFVIYYLQTRERDILRIAVTPQVRGDRGPECRLTAMPFGFAAWFLPFDQRNVRGTRHRCRRQPTRPDQIFSIIVPTDGTNAAHGDKREFRYLLVLQQLSGKLRPAVLV